MNDDLARTELVRPLMRSSVTLDEAGMRELLPILQKFLTELNQASPGDRPLAYRLASLADGRIRAALGSEPAAQSIDLLFPASTAVPLPADTILPGEIRHYDVNDVAAVLLAVITWLITFAGPIMISKLPTADQSTMTDYYSGIPGLAIALTGYFITHRPSTR